MTVDFDPTTNPATLAGEVDLALAGDFAAGDEPMCDGVHADDAPDHLLCTRCYPNGSDGRSQDDLQDEDLAYGESNHEDMP